MYELGFKMLERSQWGTEGKSSTKQNNKQRGCETEEEKIMFNYVFSFDCFD